MYTDIITLRLVRPTKSNRIHVTPSKKFLASLSSSEIRVHVTPSHSFWLTDRRQGGYKPTKAIRMDAFLAITKNGSYYVLTHIKTGGCVYKNPDHRAVLVFYLTVKDFNWDWEDSSHSNLSDSSENLKKYFHELESLLPFLNNA